jgi:signal transduction histidine kinase
VDRIADDPVLALDAIREALVLPYASLRVQGEDLAVSGTAVTHTRRLPLGDGSGEIVVGLRAGDLALSAGDEHVLRIVAPLLAQTLRAQALAVDLQEAREYTIASLEEERRRLRRDLHDGLGPTLSGIAFTADAARNTLRTEPETADTLLRALRTETVAAVGEIRRLVYAMRPPALDELGLVGALRQQAALIGTASGRPLIVDFRLADDLPTLTAATEVAAYRIMLEALTNAARHSGSEHASASLSVAEKDLVLEVCDEGHTDGGWQEGVGFASMRERAAEVGGTLAVSAGAGGGRVTARLPVLAAPEDAGKVHSSRQ